MRNQSVRLYLYSSMAIAALTLVWGLRSIPKQADLAEATIRSSVEQELLTLAGAVKASTQALRYRLLDVLKAEGNDHNTRSFQNSPFVAATLIEWDQTQWKPLWHSSKIKTQFQPQDIKTWMIEWPLAKLAGEETFYVKVGDWQGQPYFAVVAPVRKPNNTAMIGIGIFPANQFGLVLPLTRQRDVKVFDEKGFALALSRPAYLGSSVKRESLVDEMLESGEVHVRHEFKNPKGLNMYGMATKIAGSNIYVSIESALRPAVPFRLASWLYLVFAAAGALGLNWFLFFTFNKPLLQIAAEQEKTIEQLRKKIKDGPVTLAVQTGAIEDEWRPDDAPEAAMGNKDFMEPDTMPVVPTLLKSMTLQKVVQAALRSLDGRIKEYGIQVAEKGLQSIPVSTDALQLQTAIEEIFKNCIEAMQFSKERWLTITGVQRDGKVFMTIEDTGVGVGKDNLRKVFDPFFSTKDSEGVARGLGLNVARRVVEEMRGKVAIESHQSETASGTTVEMEWPLPESAAPEKPEKFMQPAEAMMVMAANSAPIGEKQIDELLSDLDLLADEYEITDAKNWPDVPIRKPIVRSLD